MGSLQQHEPPFSPSQRRTTPGGSLGLVEIRQRRLVPKGGRRLHKERDGRLVRPSINPEHQTETPATITAPCPITQPSKVLSRNDPHEGLGSSSPPAAAASVEPHLSEASKGGRGRSGALAHLLTPAIPHCSFLAKEDASMFYSSRPILPYVNSDEFPGVKGEQSTPCVSHPTRASWDLAGIASLSVVAPRPEPPHHFMGLRRAPFAEHSLLLPACLTHTHAYMLSKRTHAVDPLAQRRLSLVEPKGLLDRMWHPHIAHLALHLFEPRSFSPPFY